MNVVDSPDLLPGSCYVTGRSDGPFIDTGIDIDDRPNIGRVYLAASFISDCSAILGGLGPEPAQILRDQLAAAQERIVQLEEVERGLTTANEALFAGGYRPVAVPEAEDLNEVDAAETRGQVVAMLSGLSDDRLVQSCIDHGIDLNAFEDRAQIVEALADVVLVIA